MNVVVPVGTDYAVTIGRDVQVVVEGSVRVAIIFSNSVAVHARRVAAQLDRDVLMIEVPDAELGKSLAVAEHCWARLGDGGFTRDDVIVGVGGGAVTDLAGFVAACWLRGVRVVQVPTSLLGMVDAAVGGKAGVNTATGKNLVGAFHPPVSVWCDLSTIDTLPEVEWVNGLAEVIKCGFIADPVILDLVADGYRARIADLVERSVRIKADIVAGDLRDTGRREFLNYGHTFGHAIERRENYRWRHGCAVSVGLVYAAALARLAGNLDSAVANRHAQVLDSVGLPISYSPAAWPELRVAMQADKKTRGAVLRFVVLDGLALPRIMTNPSEDLLQQAYREVGV